MFRTRAYHIDGDGEMMVVFDVVSPPCSYSGRRAAPQLSAGGVFPLIISFTATVLLSCSTLTFCTHVVIAA